MGKQIGALDSEGRLCRFTCKYYFGYVEWGEDHRCNYPKPVRDKGDVRGKYTKKPYCSLASCSALSEEQREKKIKELEELVCRKPIQNVIYDETPQGNGDVLEGWVTLRKLVWNEEKKKICKYTSTRGIDWYPEEELDEADYEIIDNYFNVIEKKGLEGGKGRNIFSKQWSGRKPW